MTAALIVLCHPAKTSLSHMIVQTIRASLHSRGTVVDLLDLYEDNFAPALTPEERANYYATAPALSAIAEHASRLSRADILILVFPTWWYGMPAMLKGWIDRTFAPTVAFDHSNDLGPIKPRLTNLKSVLVITTLGSPWWIDWFVMRRPVRRIFKTAIFGLCAPQAKFKMLSFYKAENPTPERVTSFTSKILKALSRH
jgi:NAD(P)H dehydrogenase (quinone)